MIRPPLLLQPIQEQIATPIAALIEAGSAFWVLLGWPVCGVHPTLPGRQQILAANDSSKDGETAVAIPVALLRRQKSSASYVSRNELGRLVKSQTSQTLPAGAVRNWSSSAVYLADLDFYREHMRDFITPTILVSLHRLRVASVARATLACIAGEGVRHTCSHRRHA